MMGAHLQFAEVSRPLPHGLGLVPKSKLAPWTYDRLVYFPYVSTCMPLCP
jgi:hypothetical protein